MFTALLDANVLVPISLADTVLRAAEKEIYLPRWSKAILGETDRALRRVRPDLPESRVRARLTAMNDRFPEACVEHFEGLVPTIHLPDANDRHVLAAAVVGHADVIVTRNLKDFPPEDLAPWNLETVDPDTFLRDMLDLLPDIMVKVIIEQAADKQHPAQGIDDVLISLERAGVPGSVKDVHDQLKMMRG